MDEAQEPVNQWRCRTCGKSNQAALLREGVSPYEIHLTATRFPGKYCTCEQPDIPAVLPRGECDSMASARAVRLWLNDAQTARWHQDALNEMDTNMQLVGIARHALPSGDYCWIATYTGRKDRDACGHQVIARHDGQFVFADIG